MFDPYQPTTQDWRQQQMAQQEAMRQSSPIASTTNNDMFSPIMADDIQGILSEIMARTQRAAEQGAQKKSQGQGQGIASLFGGGGADTSYINGGMLGGTFGGFNAF